METVTARRKPTERTTSLSIPQTYHLRVLRVASLASVGLTVILMYSAASVLPPFDSSPNAMLPGHSLVDNLARPLLRWDAFHFVHVAEQDYTYEHEWAFFPGASLVMRTIASKPWLATFLPGTHLHRMLLGGAIASCVCGTATTLYDLTIHHFGSDTFAFLASLLAVLPSSPATLYFSAYNEPFFTYLSYRGMLYCARAEWLLATLCFAAASTFRSNGILLCVYILWGLVGQQLLASQLHISRICKAAVLCLVIISPFLLHQYRAYQTFCLGAVAGNVPVWCTRTLPFIYSYVQDYYWNVGFLRYWTLSQLPNILLAAPPLLSIFSYSTVHLRANLVPALLALIPGSRTPPLDTTRTLTPFSITPHAVHSLLLASVLLFAAHTQIALRFAASLPLTYWAAAWLVLEHPRGGRWWVSWSVVWGAISIVLWAVFLPPA